MSRSVIEMLRRARRHGDSGCPVLLVTGEEKERNTWEESEWWVLDQMWLQGCRSSSRTRAASPRDTGTSAGTSWCSGRGVRAVGCPEVDLS